MKSNWRCRRLPDPMAMILAGLQQLSKPAAPAVPALTEDDVRRIIRDEFKKLVATITITTT